MKATSRRTLPAGSRRLTGLLIVELHDCRWSLSLREWLKNWQPAGVILGCARLSTPGATADLLARIAKTLVAPPILGLREVGGGFSPFTNFLPHIPSARAAGQRGPGAAKSLGELIGRALKLIGFNTYFGPSLDLSAPYSDRLLDNRIFSSDPGMVSRCAGAFIQGLHRFGIRSAPGHFPGISDATRDSVTEMHVADKSMVELWREDLIPFRKLLPQSRLVAISHLPYKAYDIQAQKSACVSPNVLNGLLREKLHFRGAAVADFPGAMKLLSNAPSLFSTGEDGICISLDLSAIVESIAMGCDLQVIGPGEKWGQLVLEGLERSVQSGALTSLRLNEAARRVQAARKGLRRPIGRLNGIAFKKLSREFEELSKTCKE